MSAIAPESVNPLNLPSLPLEWRKGFPKCPAIYFAISGEKILYIGRAKNLLRRWRHHHRQAELETVEEVKIAWLEVNDIQLLPVVEKALIQYFRPQFNYVLIAVRKPKSGRDRGTHPNSLANLTWKNGRPIKFGAKKVRHCLSISEEGWAGIAQMAEAAGCTSVSDFLEKLGRGELKTA